MGNGNEKFKNLLARSSTASCSPGERFVTVKKENLVRKLSLLKKKGFMTEVTVPTRKTNLRKIYFARNMII